MGLFKLKTSVQQSIKTNKMFPTSLSKSSKTSKIKIVIGVLLICFLIINTTLFSQKNPNINYWKYYYNMEESLIDSNFKIALEYYDILYNEYEFIYANHAFIGLQLCAINAEEQSIQKYIEKCFQAGILEEVLKNNLIIKKHIPNIEKYNINYDSIRAIYIGRINLKIREEIIRMDSLDNIATDKVNKSFLHYFQWRRVSKRNAKRIFEIIETYGYPSEKLIGINQNLQLIDTISDYKIGLNIFNHAFRTTNMLVHYFSDHTKAYQEKNQILLEEVIKGNLKPSDYGIFMDFQARWKFTNPKKEFYYNVWHLDPYQRLNEINNRRTCIGLKPADYQIKKKEFVIKNRKEGFTNIYIDYF